MTPDRPGCSAGRAGWQVLAMRAVCTTRAESIGLVNRAPSPGRAVALLGRSVRDTRSEPVGTHPATGSRHGPGTETGRLGDERSRHRLREGPARPDPSHALARVRVRPPGVRSDWTGEERNR